MIVYQSLRMYFLRDSTQHTDTLRIIGNVIIQCAVRYDQESERILRIRVRQRRNVAE